MMYNSIENKFLTGITRWRQPDHMGDSTENCSGAGDAKDQSCRNLTLSEGRCDFETIYHHG